MNGVATVVLAICLLAILGVFVYVAWLEIHARRIELSAERERQALLIRLDSKNLSHDFYRKHDLLNLESKLSATLSRKQIAEVHGNVNGFGGATVYCYGKDAERIFHECEKVLRSHPICQGARVILRLGGPGAPEREVSL